MLEKRVKGLPDYGPGRSGKLGKGSIEHGVQELHGEEEGGAEEDFLESRGERASGGKSGNLVATTNRRRNITKKGKDDRKRNRAGVAGGTTGKAENLG